MYENESVNFIEAQKYESDCCGSSFLNHFTYGSNLILTSSNAMPPDVLGKFIYTDCEPHFDEESEGMQVLPHDESESCFSTYFNNVKTKFFAKRDHPPVTSQYDIH